MIRARNILQKKRPTITARKTRALNRIMAVTPLSVLLQSELEGLHTKPRNITMTTKVVQTNLFLLLREITASEQESAPKMLLLTRTPLQ